MSFTATIISVYDKTDLDKILNQICKLNIEIIATSGTAKYISNMGLKVIEVSNYINFEEAPNGLVKTLHPKIYAGILLNPKNPEHKEYMEKHNIKHIKIVIVNFYPFEKAILKGFKEAVYNIDIGGIAIARAAAKAALLYSETIVLTNPKQYNEVIFELENYGWARKETILKLAIEAFQSTLKYENEILKYFLEVLK